MNNLNMNTEEAEIVSGEPAGKPETQKNKKKVIVAGVMGACLLLVLSVVFSDQLYTAAIAPLIFRATASPTKVTQGSKLTLKWTTNATNRAKYPYERVAFCIVVKGKNGNCKNMIMATPNDGKELVVANVGPGTYRAVLQAMDANKKLVPGVTVSSNGFKVVAAPKTSNGGGGSGGNGGGGNSGSGGSSSSTPTVNDLGITINHVCIDPDDFEVYLSWSPSKTATVRFRKVGETTWRYPLGSGNNSPYSDSDASNSRNVLIFNPESEPQHGYDLQPNTDFEVVFVGANGQSPTIHRYNSGPEPAANEHFDACGFRDLGPSGTKRPDLTAEDLNITGELRAGQKLYFSAMIKNIGEHYAPTPQGGIKIDIGNDGVYDYSPRYSNPSVLPTLMTGDNHSVTWTDAWIAQEGTNKVQICADPGETMAEPNKNNNCVERVFTVAPPEGPLSDLTITNPTVNNETGTFDMYYSNIGAGVSEKTTLRLRVDLNNDGLWETQYVNNTKYTPQYTQSPDFSMALDALNPDESRLWAGWKIPEGDPNTQGKAEFCIDQPSTIIPTNVESNKNNNCQEMLYHPVAP